MYIQYDDYAEYILNFLKIMHIARIYSVYLQKEERTPTTRRRRSLSVLPTAAVYTTGYWLCVVYMMILSIFNLKKTGSITAEYSTVYYAVLERERYIRSSIRRRRGDRG